MNNYFNSEQDLYRPPLLPPKEDLHSPDSTRRYQINNVLRPLMISKSFPQQYPMLTFPKSTTFLNSDEFFVDKEARVFFHDWQTGEVVYMSDIDTTNHVQTTQATIIMNDLSHRSNKLKVPGTNRDTVVYANRVEIKYIDKPSTIAGTDRNGNIFFSTNHTVHNILDNIYEIVNTFQHELIHKRDNHHLIYTKDKKEIPHLVHAEVYKEQMTYDEFSKTSFDFQLGIVKMYAINVIRGNHGYPNRKNEFTINAINREFELFNNTVGKKIEATVSYIHHQNDPNKRKIKICLKGKCHDLLYKEVYE